GGVLRFLRSVMPHVVEGIVVDTGSIDGTRDLLERAKEDFPNLRVFDCKFEGYAEARNFSLRHCRSRRALVLDADELILQEDFPRIAKIIVAKPSIERWSFNFNDIRGMNSYDGPGHPTRLFDAQGNEFYNEDGWHGEFLTKKETFWMGVKILHFRPPNVSGSYSKIKDWYGQKELPSESPSNMQGFESWRDFNPKRDNYRGSDLDIVEICS
ncbi:MAG: glycosyltransferase, partial [archaeon]|nr:glycosyltransferase [archaeon]